MEKEDLKNFTKEEITDLFIQLMNEMETTGNNYMNAWNNRTDKSYKLDDHIYASGILKYFNRSKARISLLNEQKKLRAEKLKRINK